MPVTGTQAWIQTARAAAQTLRAERPPRVKPSTAPPARELPAISPGLRNPEQTQSMEALEGKGRIINRYL